MREISHPIGDVELPRAYRLLDALFRAVDSLGGRALINANGSTCLHLTGDPVRIRLRSQQSGAGVLSIEEHEAPRKNWRDTKRTRLEDILGAFLIAVCECGHVLQLRREAREEAEQRRRLAEEERRLKAQRYAEELMRYQKLEACAGDWHKARAISAYLDALKASAAAVEDEEKRAALLAEVAWGREKVAWLDPLIDRPDPILGRRQRPAPDQTDGRPCPNAASRNDWWVAHSGFPYWLTRGR